MKMTCQADEHQRPFVGNWQASCLDYSGEDYDGEPLPWRRGVITRQGVPAASPFPAFNTPDDAGR